MGQPGSQMGQIEAHLDQIGARLDLQGAHMGQLGAQTGWLGALLGQHRAQMYKVDKQDLDLTLNPMYVTWPDATYVPFFDTDKQEI